MIDGWEVAPLYTVPGILLLGSQVTNIYTFM